MSKLTASCSMTASALRKSGEEFVVQPETATPHRSERGTCTQARSRCVEPHQRLRARARAGVGHPKIDSLSIQPHYIESSRAWTRRWRARSPEHGQYVGEHARRTRLLLMSHARVLRLSSRTRHA